MTEQAPIKDMAWDKPLELSMAIGEPGRLAFLAIDELVIDQTYQRPIMASGNRNIRKIAEEFNWAYFAPLVVAPRPGGKFAVIDGQHKATAAKARGDIKKVPCLIINADYATQARAFSVINGNVTKLSMLSTYRARLAAGDHAAREIQDACTRAGVMIAPYPKAPAYRQPNETFAIGSIDAIYRRFGAKVLERSLQLLVQAKANDLIGKMAVRGIAACLGLNPNWMKPSVDELVGALGRGGLRPLYQKAITGRIGGEGYTQFTGYLAEKFTEAFGPGVPAKPKALPAVVKLAKAVKPEQVGNVGGLRKTDMRRVPVRLDKKDRVSTDEKALIEAHLKTHGVRKFESGATGHTSNLLDWLQLQGHKTRRLGARERKPYEIDKKRYDLKGLFEFANKARRKLKLEPFTLGEPMVKGKMRSAPDLVA